MHLPVRTPTVKITCVIELLKPPKSKPRKLNKPPIKETLLDVNFLHRTPVTGAENINK